jgi:hypothetical protein
MYSTVQVLDADMYVDPEYQQRPRNHLQLVNQEFVAVPIIDLLLRPL